jgi:hypothetical protein
MNHDTAEDIRAAEDSARELAERWEELAAYGFHRELGESDAEFRARRWNVLSVPPVVEILASPAPEDIKRYRAGISWSRETAPRAVPDPLTSITFNDDVPGVNLHPEALSSRPARKALMTGIAPCGHPGEHVIGTYVKCLSGCEGEAQEYAISRVHFPAQELDPCAHPRIDRGYVAGERRCLRCGAVHSGVGGRWTP